MKYVPSQIITAALCIAVLCPAAFRETEVVKEDVTVAEGRRCWTSDSLKSPCRANSMSRCSPTISPPALPNHSGMPGVFHTPELQSLLLLLNFGDTLNPGDLVSQLPAMNLPLSQIKHK